MVLTTWTASERRSVFRDQTPELPFLVHGATASNLVRPVQFAVLRSLAATIIFFSFTLHAADLNTDVAHIMDGHSGTAVIVDATSGRILVVGGSGSGLKSDGLADDESHASASRTCFVVRVQRSPRCSISWATGHPS